MTLEQLIEKYKGYKKEINKELNSNVLTDIGRYTNTGSLNILEVILKDLEQLKETLLKKELEYKNKYQDEKDKHTKIDNAFIDGKLFAIKEIIGE